MTREEFIDQISIPAIQACKGTGLFPSVMIAQAIVECGNGESELCQKAHNYFGIKANRGWKGATVTMMTGEYIMGKYVKIPAKFRKYDSIEAGFKDRNRFLSDNPRYKKAGVFSATSPEEQALALQRAGYATDPKYASLLISVINGSGELKQYDPPLTYAS